MVEHLVPDVDNCAYYFKCVHGTFLRMRCKKGLAFHSELKICDWVESVPTCKAGTSDVGGMETMDDEKFGGDTSEMEVLDESGLKSTERAQNDRVNEEGMAWSEDQVISSRMADLTGRCSHV